MSDFEKIIYVLNIVFQFVYWSTVAVMFYMVGYVDIWIDSSSFFGYIARNSEHLAVFILVYSAFMIPFYLFYLSLFSGNPGKWNNK